MKTLRIALAQINPTVGDLNGNSKKIIEYIKKAKSHSADIVVFPELAITGYPPDDLLLNKNFIKDVRSQFDRIISDTSDIATILGFPRLSNNRLFNAAGIISDRKLINVYHKRYLVKSSIFDDTKYFKKGRRFPFFEFDGIFFHVLFGNEMTNYAKASVLNSHKDPDIIICIDASCYSTGRITEWENYFTAFASRHKIHTVYINMTGGQDEWVFYGGSFIANEKGTIVAKSPLFEENLILADIERTDNQNATTNHASERILISRNFKNKTEKIQNKPVSQPESLEEIFNALVLGTKDYVRKNGFENVVLGLSGGIDSALVAVIAREALGAENVTGVSMPTSFTSEESKADAIEIATNLNIHFKEIPIDTLYDTYLTIFTSIFNNQEPAQLTKENIQPRIRANILMALSNNYGCLVLTTGNKSEVGTGYSTLYGDTAGAFAVIKDVPKTLVYELSLWINKKAERRLIPQRILTKAPSAELKPDQKDTDTLPPYEILDPIMKAYIEEAKTIEEIVDMGYNIELTKRIIKMIKINEYKRRQSPIGIKITEKSFGKDMVLPVTNRYEY